jgi:hypothetical protein
VEGELLSANPDAEFVIWMSAFGLTKWKQRRPAWVASGHRVRIASPRHKPRNMSDAGH